MVEIGRVFFYPEKDKRTLNKLTVVTLECHSKNVEKLVDKWGLKGDVQDISATSELLKEAARKHDNGKPQKFKLKYDLLQESFIYSFAGHRFAVYEEHPYVNQLIRLHHEFSVDSITQAKSVLNRSKYSEFADNFQFDLYTLEMCDQIEAETASYRFTGNAEPRVFMEFSGERLNENTVAIYPYPFKENPITLTFDYCEVYLDKPYCITEDISQNKKKPFGTLELTKLSKKLKEKLKNCKVRHKEVQLCTLQK